MRYSETHNEARKDVYGAAREPRRNRKERMRRARDAATLRDVCHPSGDDCARRRGTSSPRHPARDEAYGSMQPISLNPTRDACRATECRQRNAGVGEAPARVVNNAISADVTTSSRPARHVHGDKEGWRCRDVARRHAYRFTPAQHGARAQKAQAGKRKVDPTSISRMVQRSRKKVLCRQRSSSRWRRAAP